MSCSHSVAVSIVSRTARIVPVTERGLLKTFRTGETYPTPIPFLQIRRRGPVIRGLSPRRAVADGRQLVVFAPHLLLQTSLQGTIAGVAHRPQRCRALLLPTLMPPHVDTYQDTHYCRQQILWITYIFFFFHFRFFDFSTFFIFFWYI